MHHLAVSIVHLIARYGWWGIAVSMIIENLGIPFPTEGAFLVAQRYIHQGQISFWSAYLFLVATQVIGALLAYGLGKGLREVLLRFFNKSEDFKKAKEKIEQWYKNYGSATTLITRLVGYVRPWSSLVAGFAEFSFWPFVLWTVIGTALFVYPTMKVTGLLVLVWGRFPALHLAIAIGMLLLFSAVFLYSLHRKRKNRRSGL